MPRYTFECQGEECHLRFERTLKMGEHLAHECPNCHDQAPIVVSEFSFDFKESAAAPQGNTGVHKDDYPTADHAVGKSADKRWDLYRAKEVVKTEARKAGGTHALVRQTAPDGSYIDYAPLDDVRRQARRVTARKAISALQRAKESRPNR